MYACYIIPILCMYIFFRLVKYSNCRLSTENCTLVYIFVFNWKIILIHIFNLRLYCSNIFSVHFNVHKTGVVTMEMYIWYISRIFEYTILYIYMYVRMLANITNTRSFENVTCALISLTPSQNPIVVYARYCIRATTNLLFKPIYI